METTQVKNEKRKIEAEIQKKILEYERKTGTKVTTVGLTRVAKSGVLTNVNLKTDI